ncbi:ATP-binding protein [Jeotgalibacillus soli]|uniref:histidine kinase n=1 Tax=Jeotgalibacillus soli TaxID=889306 RepID=A0A0C2VP53_9BACL|nr:ATP-binding protein [Jeotgalibacillus soli]KIL45788.1 histidine kinase [Jeotgalibacillus soli]
MELITKDLLINFLFILLSLFLLQMFYLLKYIYRLEKLKSSLFVLFPLISIILCMLFPFAIVEGFSWDLRRIPFILGVLYGGPKYGLFLLSFLLLVRFFIGGDGFYTVLLTFPLIAVITILVSKYYKKMSLKHKILTSGGLLLISNIFTFIALEEYFDIDVEASLWIQYFVISIIGMIITTILWEVIKTNFEVLERLIKADKLQVVSHLAASISHEVRNPLTVCKGFLQLSSGAQEVSPKTKEYLETAIKELDRATEIINDYLTFAKPISEKKNKINICEEIQNVVNILNPLAHMNNVQILISGEKTDSLFTLGEKKQLEQSLINIMKNGIESMSKGGVLQIGAFYENPNILIHICDQGKGMTREQINRLGEPYFSTKENGTGLGMMVSFSIIRNMGGIINVESDENGTCFTIEMPASRG